MQVSKHCYVVILVQEEILGNKPPTHPPLPLHQVITIDFFWFQSMFILAIHSNKRQETVSMPKYRVFSHDVTAAILVSQNNETVAMLVSQTSPVGVELFSCGNAFFCSNKFA